MGTRFRKIVKIALLVVGGLAFLIGLPTLAFGGWVFLLIGAPCLFFGLRRKEKPKKSAAATPTFSKPTPPTTPVQPAKPAQPEPVQPAKPEAKIKTYKVTGTSHYLENILSLALKNDDYSLSKRQLIEDGLVDERVWEYDFYPHKAELVPEPENPYDPKAIMVLVDGQHVGYIKAGSCSHLLRVIAEDRIEKIDVKVGGGRYKRLNEDYDEDGNEIYEMEKDTVPHFVHLNITEKPEA